MIQRLLNLLLVALLPVALVACPEKKTEPSESPSTESGDKAGTVEEDSEGETEEAETEGEEKEEESDDEGGW
jgi:hypothetical protein